MKRRYNEKGSITIEAALALPLFMMAFLAILLLSKTVRAEANVQYAIDQTAKEISQYYYVINKLGLTAENEPDAEQLTKMDEFLESLNGFSSSVKSSAENAADYSINTENIDIKTLSNDIKTICDGLTSDYNSIKSSAEKVGEKFNAIAEDPMAIIQCMVTMLKSQVTNEVLSRFVAQPLCKAIMPKYITNQGDVNDTLEDMGVVDGFDGIDFGLSTFMKDGKSINVVVLYKIKVVGFGFIDYELNIKQTASTAAWGSDMTFEELEKKEESSPWTMMAPLQRGQFYTKKITDENKGNVCDSTGIDMYFSSESSSPVIGRKFPSNTYVSVHSINVFSSSYSKFSGEKYELKASPIKSALKSYAKKLISDTDKLGDKITMNGGEEWMLPPAGTEKHRYMVIVVPNEANLYSTELVSIGKEIKKETGVDVIWTFRDTALDAVKRDNDEDKGEA